MYTLVLAVLAVLLPGAFAQQANYSDDASFEAGDEATTQFVFVIDDSGSMAGNHTTTSKDPNRVAVLAAKALLSIIPDQDSATVVRLNRKSEEEKGESVESPLGLSRLGDSQRQKIDAQLDRIASYYGKSTPCQSALQDVQSILNEGYDEKSTQVVFFLTDGKCSGGEEPQVSAFLDGVDSERADMLRFYFLALDEDADPRALNRTWPEFADLSEKTDGNAAIVQADDPRAILEAFAFAIADAKGLASYVRHTNKKNDLPAHTGAVEMRLLALVPGGDDNVQFDLRNDKGVPLSGLPNANQDSYRYEEKNSAGTGYGKSFKSYGYAWLTYTPREHPVQVRVKGEPNRWSVIAIPFYRIRLDINAYEVDKGCENLGLPNPTRPPAQIVDHQSRHCVTVTALKGAENVTQQLVSGGKGVSARIFLKRGVEYPEGTVKQEAPTSLDSFSEHSAFGRAYPAKIDNSMLHYQAYIELKFDDVKRKARRFSRKIRVDVQSMENEWVEGLVAANNWESAGEGPPVLVPGGSLRTSVTLKGNLSDTQAKATLRGLEDYGHTLACVSVKVQNADEGSEAAYQWDEQGKTVPVVLQADRWCGATPTARSEPYKATIWFEADGAGPEPLDIEFAFENQFSLTPSEETLELEAGDKNYSGAYTLKSNVEPGKALHFTAEVDLEKSDFPEKDLLSFVFDSSSLVFDSARAPEAVLEYEVDVDGCCDEGSYSAAVKLRPDTEKHEIAATVNRHHLRTGLPKDEITKALLIDGLPSALPIKVQPDQENACLWEKIFMILKILFYLWLLWALFNMWTKSHFLTKGKLPPLQHAIWRGTRPVVDSSCDTGDIAVNMEAELDFLAWPGWVGRFARWAMHAWRLALTGIPGCGGEYHEVLVFSGLEQGEPSAVFPHLEGRSNKTLRTTPGVCLYATSGSRARGMWVPEENVLDSSLIPKELIKSFQRYAKKPEKFEDQGAEPFSADGQMIVRNPNQVKPARGKHAGWAFG